MNSGEKEAMEELVEVIRRIREKCPWDSAQTLVSLKERFVCETEEVLEAIDRTEADQGSNLKEELGDLLMLVVLESLIAQEEKLFSLEDVMRGITWKMKFRHPRIFPPEYPGLENLSWEELKEKEREIKKSFLNKTHRNGERSGNLR